MTNVQTNIALIYKSMTISKNSILKDQVFLVTFEIISERKYYLKKTGKLFVFNVDAFFFSFKSMTIIKERRKCS